MTNAVPKKSDSGMFRRGSRTSPAVNVAPPTSVPLLLPMMSVVFASPDTAASAARGPRSHPRDDSRAWNVENVTVYEQLTSA